MAGAVKPQGPRLRVEASSAGSGDERLGSDLMEKVCERRNLQAALKRVRRNAGSPGIDGMTVEELAAHLRVHWPRLREDLLAGRYGPQASKAGGHSKARRRRARARHSDGLGPVHPAGPVAGLATAASTQPSRRRATAFGPDGRAHDAVRRAQAYVQDGRSFVVDIDLEKFFDRVNHDILMGRLAKRMADSPDYPGAEADPALPQGGDARRRGSD